MYEAFITRLRGVGYIVSQITLEARGVKGKGYNKLPGSV